MTGRLTADQPISVNPNASGLTMSRRTDLSAEQGVTLPGATTDIIRNPLVQGAAAPGCLTLADALALMQCISDPSTCPPGVSLTPERLALPLCAGEAPPPLPTCSSADTVTGLAYCDQFNTYPVGSKFGNPMDGLCWLAQKYPAWYASLKALPPCGGATPDLPPPKTAGEEDKGHNQLLIWGGVVVALLLVGGGVYYATKKKK